MEGGKGVGGREGEGRRERERERICRKREEKDLYIHITATLNYHTPVFPRSDATLE